LSLLEKVAILLKEFSNGSTAFAAMAGLVILRTKHKEQT
jgi:hypothetical protein